MLGKNREVLATGWIRERARGCAELARRWRMLWVAQFGSRVIGCGEFERKSRVIGVGQKRTSEAAVQWKQQGSG